MVTMLASPWLQSADGAIEERMLLEVALALAVTTGAPAAHTVSTTALSVHELRLSQLDSETLVARARTVNSGSLFTFAEVLVEDGADGIPRHRLVPDPSDGPCTPAVHRGRRAGGGTDLP
jgi:hypothetical protein